MNTEIGLYQQNLLAHHKNPIGFKKQISVTHSADGDNAVCGDEITVEVNISAGKIQALAFLGDSCAICRASASMMCQYLLDQSIDNIEDLIKIPMALINGVHKADVTLDECFSSLTVIEKYPVRKQCALLPWQTLISAINKNP
jgi:nitrogen fixation NifU-like protein